VNHSKSLFAITFLLLFVVLSSAATAPRQSVVADSIEAKPDLWMALADHTPHSRISIGSDGDFALQATSEGWAGNGTEFDPYIIEGYIISSDQSCIRITGTYAYFVIRDCVLETITGGWDFGISLSYAHNGVVDSCLIRGKYLGIAAWTVYDFAFVNNTIYDTDIALNIDSCRNCTVDDNTFIGCSPMVYGHSTNYWRNTFSNNTVDGKPFGWFWNVADTVIDGDLYGAITLAECTNVTVLGGTFSDATVGLQMGYCADCSLRNSLIHDVQYGVTTTFSDSVSIDNNTIYDCAELGIHINVTHNSVVSNNIVHDCAYTGINLMEPDNCVVVNNTIYRNGNGIEALVPKGCLVDNNTIMFNDYGFRTFAAYNCNIAYNKIYGNNVYGIFLEWSCRYLVIYGNRLGWNSVNARDDDNTDIYWDLGVSLGNSWSDYDGSGSYVVPGTTGSTDSYPSVLTDFTAPLIDAPADIAYALGSTGNTIIWHASDVFPGYYEILRNGSFYTWGWWNMSSEAITVNVDGLDIGVYNYTALVSDSIFNATDVVIVVVTPDTTPPVVDSPPDVEYYEGQIGNTIIWNIYDPNPRIWEIYIDGEFDSMGLWNTPNDVVLADIDGLPVGVHSCTIIIYDDNWANSTDTVVVSVFPADHMPHDPIVIWGDADLISQAAIEGWNGNGTASNPYVIQWLAIVATGSCIRVYDVTLYLVIYNCTLDSHNSGDGVYIRDCSHISIISCVAYDNLAGVYISGSSDCHVIDGIFYDSSEASVTLSYSTECEVTDNHFNEKGVYIIGYYVDHWYHTISGNLISGRSIGYFVNVTDASIDASPYAQIILVDCTRVDVYDGSFTMQAEAVSLAFCEDCSLYMNYIGSNTVGVYIHLSTGIVLANNTISSNQYIGIHLNGSQHCSLLGNDILYNGMVGVVAYDAEWTVFAHNTITGHLIGIEGGWMNYSEFYGNTVFGNEYGLIIWDSNGCFFYQNTIANNTNIGLQFDMVWNCTVFGNIFDSPSINAMDYGHDNNWDDGVSIGNTWSDYYGVEPYYSVPGSGNGVDHYPISLHGIDIWIDHPANIEYEVGTTGHTITWHAFCSNPTNYSIHRDGSLIIAAVWNGGDVSVNINGLAAGTYEYTITVLGFGSQSATDTVRVTVTAGSTSPGPTTSPWPEWGILTIVGFAITTGSLVIIVIFGILILKNRREAQWASEFG